jgi:periplasmic protein TonB
VRHLQQYKRYPSDAQSRGDEGMVQLSSRSQRPRSQPRDRAQLRPSRARRRSDVNDRAQPLPPFPASMPQAKLDLTVPIRFSLR